LAASLNDLFFRLKLMSYVLKRDPAWLESLPIDSTADAFAALTGDNGHVSVPATLLLAVVSRGEYFVLFPNIPFGKSFPF
jgi:hypothetical protein